MKAVRLHGPKDVRLEDIDDPPAPGHLEVVVAPLWCGLCGSDQRNHDQPAGPDAVRPRTIGHEFSALVVEVGPGVTRLQPGDAIAAMPLEYCGECIDCLRGNFHLCSFKSFTGLFGPSALGGGLADLVLLKAYQAIPLGSLTYEQGALVEPAAVALHSILEAGVTAGDRVLVVGCGSIGCLTIMAAYAAGASEVFTREPNPNRAAIATSLGATMIDFGYADDQADYIGRVAKEYGPIDVAFDCAGSYGSIDFCIAGVKTGGRVCVVAGHQPPSLQRIAMIQQKPISIVGSLAYTRQSWDKTMNLMRAGKYPAESIVTSRIQRERVAQDGFAALTDDKPDQLKILVQVGGTRAADR